MLVNKVFTNEDCSFVGILYLASNGIEHNVAYLYQSYQARRRVEEEYKSITETPANQHLQQRR